MREKFKLIEVVKNSDGYAQLKGYVYKGDNNRIYISMGNGWTWLCDNDGNNDYPELNKLLLDIVNKNTSFSITDIEVELAENTTAPRPISNYWLSHSFKVKPQQDYSKVTDFGIF